MSGLMALFNSKFPPSMNPRDRPSDPLSRLRFALETMPGSRKYVFTPATRAEILSELYDAFWGPFAHLFLPLSNSSLPIHATLAQVQADALTLATTADVPVVPGRPCGHIFTKGESCFRCKDCALDESCVLCGRCFRASRHDNHNVSFFIAQQSGGCCDCGDTEAWRQCLQCAHHPPLQLTPDPTTTPRVLPRPIPEAPVPPVPNYPLRAPCPPELRDVMGRTIGYALDFLLDTLDYSPDEPTVPTNEADLRLQPSADPMQKDQYCVILWNDDKHSFDEVIQLICDTTNRDRKEASAMAHSIDELGREIIDMNMNVTRLLEIAQIMSKIELGVTVRRAYDTFREQVAMVIVEWLVDLSRSRLGSDTLTIRETIATELLSPRRRESNIYGSGTQIPDLSADVPNPSRIDWLFLYHTRLWKSPRMCLKEIYASVLTLSHAHKMAIGSHFAAVYHRVIDAYLLVDREAETSIKYFALQLFTVPSIASHIVQRHDLVARLLDIVINFFTNHIADNKRILSGLTASTDVGELDVESFPFKSKRFMPVFSDLRYLCHNKPVQQLIARNDAFIRKFAKVCQLFMCVHPNKRAATSHVEYETDAWISVFNVTLSLSRVIKVYGEAFAWATPLQLVDAIGIVVHEILAVCKLTNDKLDKTKFSTPTFHAVQLGDVEYSIVRFDVLEGWVSFHHSLHWLLAELLKHVDTLASVSSVRDLFLGMATEPMILTMIDFPLRVLSMVAQIRSGLWVRNGFPIRGQLLHYRDFMLRELCYDQDLYILQTSLIILDPNVVLVSILDRFGLLSFFQGAVEHPAYESAQLSSMVEEVLYVVIVLLTEKASATKMPLSAAVRREIIHALAPGPCSYTDLVKRVAERMVDDVCFEHVLSEVAHFRAPESTSDTGSYELRDELHEEVNPFYYHYARNRREEVEGVLRAWLKKKTGVADPVVVPRPIGIERGPFSVLPSLLESEVLLQIMFYATYNILVMTDAAGTTPPSSEAILDQAFYLVMLALVERASVFGPLAATKTFADDKSLVDVMCAMEHGEHFRPYTARIGWILEEVARFAPEEVRARRRVVEGPEPGADAESVRKRAAKARQEAIMAQMKAQQASFAINFDGEEVDEEDEDEDEMDVQASYGSCIVCQEDLDDSQPFGMLGLVQASRLVRKHPDSHGAYLNELMAMPPSLDRAKRAVRPATFPPPAGAYEDVAQFAANFDGFPAQHTRFGLHASMCGHMMHMECFSTYNVSVRQRHRAHMMRNHPENILRKEYVCPLCKSLGNIILPLARPATVPATTVPFSDWIRAAGISILKSRPDPAMDSLQFRNGTGEFVFWSTQDPHFWNHARRGGTEEEEEDHRMLDSLMNICKVVSQQTRHLRERPEPEQGERGAGMYLPEELVGYTVASIEVAARGTGTAGTVADALSETQQRMVRALLRCLATLARLELDGRQDGGRESVKQAIVKRLLPEWSRTSLTPFSYPFLLRDPLSVLVETAAVAPEMLQHVLVLCYYACLARTVVGMVYVLNKARAHAATQPLSRGHADLFGDVRMFFMSVVRHSPVFEHTATLVFETFGEGRIEKMLYAFTLPFLRRAAILARAVLPHAFAPVPASASAACEENEYRRLLALLHVPPLADLPHQDTLQNALSGWCAHYGHSHAASQLNCGVVLDHPAVYRMARLPVVLDNLFSGRNDRVMRCPRCGTLPVDAAICLICGVTCCMLSDCCKDTEMGGRGECNMHTRECGGVVGLYFVVKRCSILYLYAGNGSFGQSPYLDAHGEVDISMRRGRRQYIHWPRWEEIRKTWLNHGIPTTVARKLESTADNGGWENL